MGSSVINVMARIPCGSDPECQKDLKEYLELYEQLHRSIESLSVEAEVESGRYPMIEGIKNIGDLVRKTAEVLASVGVDADESKILESARETKAEDELGAIASYVFRRVLFRGLREEMKNLSWSSGRCPVCGLIPIAAVARKISYGIFTKLGLKLHCLCGFSWDYDIFKCPSCGNTARDKFEVIMINDLKIHRCLQCSHAIAIVDESPFVSGDLVPIIASYIVMRS